MKTLIIMRHAHASTGACNDFLRKLTLEGIEESKTAGLNLKHAGVIPELIVASSAARATETARELATVLQLAANQIVFDGTIYHCGSSELLTLIRHVPDNIKVMMIVGHNPAVSELVSLLSSHQHSLHPAEQVIVRSSSENWHDFDKYLHP
ncbi:MAG: hypothetical protein GX280_06385 [Lentisphaerae bacterium]|jgi:phosphohistidine phosphatase|nr:hypothetical protein [Victivallaceae bacterium]MDD3703539.1 hypothetical protein [Victivallaceae bacterium]MDD5664319.1 hypothetical protein [Victivallaceae bacterium]NLK83691.1 hypothetical protein [Lentisphaerota bacterium]